MNVLRFAVLFFAFAIAASCAEEANSLPANITVDDVTYEDVRWGTVTPATVSILHKTGAASIPLEKLTPALQKRFGYDPKKIAALRSAEEVSRKAQTDRVAEEAAQRRASIEASRQEEAKRNAAELANREQARLAEEERLRREGAFAENPDTNVLALDFIRGVLNGKELSSLSVDAVTDLLGRPDWTTKAGIGETQYEYLHYHKKGLVFCYIGQSGRQPEKIAITVYLSGQTAYDPSSLKARTVGYFSAFTGKLNNGVDGGWKMQKFLEAFRIDGAVDGTIRRDPALETSSREDDRARGWNDGSWVNYQLQIKRTCCDVKIFYDPTSRFLNRLDVAAKLTGQ